MKNMIPLHKPYLDKDEINEARKVLESGWLVQGSKVKEIEDEMKKITGTKYAIACTNCTTALHLALLSFDIGRGDIVLVADYTFPATGHSVVHCGAIPVFIDVDPFTYNMDPKDLEAKILECHIPNIKAIIPVHTFGQCADMDPINMISEKYGIPVIEDAACAVGSMYKGRPAGSLGDIACFSFHAAKGVTCGEGGMVITNDEKIAKKIQCLRHFGIDETKASWNISKSNEFVIPGFKMIGYNYRMTDISAAIGVAQLKKLNAIIHKKQELSEYWNEKLKELSEFITPPFVSSSSFHNWQGYTTLVNKDIDRNGLIQKLKDRGIGTQIGTYASHILDVYTHSNPCPVSLDVYNRAFRLPMYYELTEEQIDKAVEILKEILKEK